MHQTISHRSHSCPCCPFLFCLVCIVHVFPYKGTYVESPPPPKNCAGVHLEDLRPKAQGGGAHLYGHYFGQIQHFTCKKGVHLVGLLPKS